MDHLLVPYGLRVAHGPHGAMLSWMTIVYELRLHQRHYR